MIRTCLKRSFSCFYLFISDQVVFATEGHYLSFDVKEEPKKNRWNGFLCFLLGVGQIMAGVAVCAYSAGFASPVGLNLIMEGVSDCIEGAKGMITGTFSWVQWAIGKAISLATSLLCFGIGKACKWFKTGGNVFKGCFSKLSSSLTTVGAKQSLKQALKYTAKTVALQAGMAMVDAGMEKMVEEATQQFFKTFKFKEDFVRFAKNSGKIEACIKRAVHSLARGKVQAGFEITQHVRQSIQDRVLEFQEMILEVVKRRKDYIQRLLLTILLLMDLLLQPILLKFES